MNNFRQKFKRITYQLPQGWLVLACGITLAVVFPMGYILAEIFTPNDSLWQHTAENLLTDYLAQTSLLLLGVSVLSLLLGVSAAWLLSIYKFPLARFCSWALVLPLSIPAYLNAATYKNLFDTQGFLGFLLLPSAPMNIWGLMLVMAVVLYPYVYLISRNVFEKQSQSLLEVSAMLGKSSWATFWQMALPLARPAVMGGLFLVMMEVLNEYGAVKYYGVSTLTKGIFRAWFSFGNLGVAVKLAAFLMLFVGLLTWAEYRQRGKKKFYNAAFLPKPIHKKQLSGIKAWVATAVCCLPFILGFGLPVSQLLWWALQTWQQADWQLYGLAAWHTVSLAGGSAVFITLMAVLLHYALRQTPKNIWLANIANLGYAVPGAVIALGALVLFLRIEDFLALVITNKKGFWLHTTWVALLYAYWIRFLAVSANPIETGFQKISPNIDHASTLFGHGKWATLWRIHLPMLKNSLLSSALLVFVDVSKELPLTLLLRPFNFDTLATFSYQYADDERFATAAIPALLIVGIGLLPTIVLDRLSK